MESNTEPKKTDLCLTCGKPNVEPLGKDLSKFDAWIKSTHSSETVSNIPDDMCYHQYYDFFQHNFDMDQEFWDSKDLVFLEKLLGRILADIERICSFTHLNLDEKFFLNALLNTFAQKLVQNPKVFALKIQIQEWANTSIQNTNFSFSFDPTFSLTPTSLFDLFLFIFQTTSIKFIILY